MDTQQKSRVSFGPFDLDLATGELRKYGTKVVLQSQPFEVLAALLELPGQLITREELQQRVWGDVTYVDFDQGLNRAIKKVRAALTDSADEPKYIETLAKRGYRFVAPLNQVSEISPAASSASVSIRHPGASKKGAKIAVGIGTASITAALLYSGLTLSKPKELAKRNPQQLTKNAAENSLITAMISPDGNYLLFGDLTGIHLSLISTQETQTFGRPETIAAADAWFPVSWFPDQSRFVAVSTQSVSSGVKVRSWIVSVIDGAITLLRKDAFPHSVSPDGSLITFTSGGPDLDDEIWITGPRGEDARRLATLSGKGSFRNIQWAPDGRHISALGGRLNSDGFLRYFIENRDLRGSPPSLVLSQEQPLQNFDWSSEDTITFVVLNGDGALWESKIEPKTGQALSAPHRTNQFSEADICGISRSRDRKRIVFRRKMTRADVFVAELNAEGGLKQPRRSTFDDSNNLPWSWTPDSRNIIFTSDRSGSVRTYKQAIDQRIASPILAGDAENYEPHMSPGGGSILYVVNRLNSRQEKLMRIPALGGVPHLVLKPNYIFDIQCARAAGAPCLLSKDLGTDQMALALLYPAEGRVQDLCNRPARNVGGWDISPDRTEIAIMTSDFFSTNIELYSLSGQLRETIMVQGRSRISSLNYSGDGKAFYAGHLGTTGATLLRIDRKGHAEPLWHKPGANVGTWAVPSPDGRYLAILADSSADNAWMIDAR